MSFYSVLKTTENMEANRKALRIKKCGFLILMLVKIVKTD